jgi:hypothetical protein
VRVRAVDRRESGLRRPGATEPERYGVVWVERPTWPFSAATCRRASAQPTLDLFGACWAQLKPRASRPPQRAGGPFHPESHCAIPGIREDETRWGRAFSMANPFPLTPALSFWERGQRTRLSADRDAPALRTLADFLPLPGGEGRGEGEGLERQTRIPTPPPLVGAWNFSGAWDLGFGAFTRKHLAEAPR